MAEFATEQRTRAAAQATTACAHGVPAEQHAQNKIYHQHRVVGAGACPLVVVVVVVVVVVRAMRIFDDPSV